jgi:hypothetical protein
MGRDYIGRGCTKQGGQVLLLRFPFLPTRTLPLRVGGGAMQRKGFHHPAASLPPARLPEPVTVPANTMLALCALRRDDVLSGLLEQ